MMAASRLVLLFFLLASTPIASASPHDEHEAAEAPEEYDDNMPSAAELEKWLLGFNAIRHKHKDDAHAIFEAYNRFKDTGKSKSGVQALGLQEMRAFLKDVGVGDVVLRTALVEVAFVALDSSGDGRVSEAELAAALRVSGCVLGEYVDPGSRPTDDITAPSRRLQAQFDEVGRQKTFNAVATALRAEVHERCEEPLRAWWGAGWLERLAAEERASPIVHSDLAAAHTDSPDACADLIVARLFAGKEGQPADGKAVRAALKTLGVASPFARHLAARGLLGALDADGDKKLSLGELRPDALRVCRAYGAVAARKTTVAHLVRALSLREPAGFPLESYLRVLGGGGHGEQAAAQAAQSTIEPDTVVELIQAYARLAPNAVLTAAAPASNDKSEL